MRSKVWLAARLSLRLARLPRTASRDQRPLRLRSTRAAAPVLLAHTEVTKNRLFFDMGPKLRYPVVCVCVQVRLAVEEQTHEPTILVLKKKRRKTMRRQWGNRREVTIARVTAIETGSAFE